MLGMKNDFKSVLDYCRLALRKIHEIRKECGAERDGDLDRGYF